MERFIRLPSVANVAAGSDASVNIPVGPTYENIVLALTNITLAQITDIELRLAGKPVMKFKSGTELDNINKHWGRGASASGLLTLHFRRPEFNMVGDQKLFNIGTADLPTASLHFHIDAACVSPAVLAYCTQNNVPQKLGIITKVKRFPFNSAVTGEVDIDNIPRTGARIAAVHLVKTDVSAVKVDVDSVNVYNASKTLGAQMQTQAGRTPQTGAMTTVDFLLGEDPMQALRTAGVQDLRIKPTLDTAGAMDLVVEYFDGLEGI